ncbi:MAG: hypothetical protein M3004_06845 [Bacteroidota bacterium]|nr:hypothetical protein [Bacteroidota bacterium]
MEAKRNISVVYLIWLPAGTESFYKFIYSYLHNIAGLSHQLIMLFKDSEIDSKDTDPYHRYLEEMNIHYTSLYFKGGLDIDAYFFAAKNISKDLILFLNTNSILLSDNWLLKMYDNIIKENVAMVAATGSFQSYSSTAFIRNSWQYERQKSFSHNFRKYKLFIKSFFYYKLFFKSFPNPHLRTNGFMIWKNIFLEIKYKPLTSKLRAYSFESGRNSITNQILKNNKNVLVVDKFGNKYEINSWYDSKTFWSFNQENLLIADNQTKKYLSASENKRRIYTLIAWGRK